MRRGATAGRATKKPIIVLAGEDRNDRKCLRILLEALCADMRGRIVEITDDVRLHKASGANLRQRVETLSKKIRAKGAREEAAIACVFIHEDFDRPDGPDCLSAHQRVQDALDRHFDTAHYVLAVPEIEAWMLLFPQALAAVTSGWRVPPRYRNRDTGRFDDPKHVLVSEACRSGRRYRESDAPAVFEKIVSLRAYESLSGSNRSWDKLRGDIRTCSTEHL